MSHISTERSQTITLSRDRHPELGPQNREPSFPAFVRVILIMPTCFSSLSLSLSLPQLNRITQPFTLQFHLDKLFTSLCFLNTSVSATRLTDMALCFTELQLLPTRELHLEGDSFHYCNGTLCLYTDVCSALPCFALLCLFFFPCFFMTSDTLLMYFLPCCRWKTPLYFNYSLVVIYCE